MTAIVAIEHDGKVWMGADSAGLIGDSWDLRRRREDDPKISVFPNHGLIIGCAGSRRWCSAIADYFTPPDELTDEGATARGYLAVLVTALRQLASEQGILMDGTVQQVNGVMLVGYRGTLWELDGDFALARPLNNYAAIGCGDQVALGAIYAYLQRHERDLQAMPDIVPPMINSIIHHSLTAAEHFSAGVRGPFVVMGV